MEFGALIICNMAGKTFNIKGESNTYQNFLIALLVKG
jgi:hypothetical protein